MHKTVRGWLLDLLADLGGGLLYAVGIDTFARTADFAPGGISGLALIADHLWGLPVGLMSLVFNVPVVLLSFRLLGRRFLLRSLRSMLACTVFMDWVLPAAVTPYGGSPLLAALYSGACLGAGMALFYMRGSSSGGADFLIVSVKTLRPHLSIGAVGPLLDLVVILLGWPVFGDVDAVLYGVLSTAVSSIVIDKILYGMDAGKLLVIITTKGRQVASRIAAESGRGSTMLRAAGSYTGTARQVLLCACSKSQAFRVRACVYEVDAAAFVMIAETSEVYGEGFRPAGG